MNVIEKIVRGYLNKVGFNRLNDKPRYIKRNIVEISAALVYSAVSIYCIFIEEASLLVLFLNGLCMLRTILKNAMKSTEMTDVINERIEQEYGSVITVNDVMGKYHYYHKGMVQITIGVVVFIVMVGMDFNTSEQLIKWLTYLIIAVVFLDDLESMIINMYDAYIEPFINIF